jgi:hypothetical protein
MQIPYVGITILQKLFSLLPLQAIREPAVDEFFHV